jgi:predicted nucleic acid-binding protein
MKHIYLDTNIIIDLLANRTPWSNDAAIIFEAAEQGRVRLYTSSLSFVIIYYVLKKELSPIKLRDTLSNLKDLISLIAVNDSCIEGALKSKVKDFEDAVQLEVALSQKKISILVTRNPKDFVSKRLAIMNSREAKALVSLVV